MYTTELQSSASAKRDTTTVAEDPAALAAQAQLLRKVEGLECHLVLSAASGAREIRSAAKRFVAVCTLSSAARIPLPSAKSVRAVATRSVIRLMVAC